MCLKKLHRALSKFDGTMTCDRWKIREKIVVKKKKEKKIKDEQALLPWQKILKSMNRHLISNIISFIYDKHTFSHRRILKEIYRFVIITLF